MRSAAEVFEVPDFDEECFVLIKDVLAAKNNTELLLYELGTGGYCLLKINLFCFKINT